MTENEIYFNGYKRALEHIKAALTKAGIKSMLITPEMLDEMLELLKKALEEKGANI